MVETAPFACSDSNAAARLQDRAEDRRMLSAAADITRELATAKPWIYWTDLLATSAIAYGALAGSLLTPLGGWSIALAIVAMLAFYRAISFIHELTHIKAERLPGFAVAWNMLMGIPLLTPSFMYDDVHILHHSRVSYGTAKDPEYLPLASMTPIAVILFVIVAALAPIGLLVRFAVLGPLSVLSPRLRKLVVERYSALAINPAFRRRLPTGTFRRDWLILENLTSLWAIVLVTGSVIGLVEIKSLIIGMSIGSGIAVANQVRTLAAHLWENESGQPMNLTAQYLDSVNIPPPAALPALWAPVGLRYHGLHHLLPSLPYHALAEAHRRLTQQLGVTSTFRLGDHVGLRSVLVLIVRKARA
jgi:fatty acid desaturase